MSSRVLLFLSVLVMVRAAAFAQEVCVVEAKQADAGSPSDPTFDVSVSLRDAKPIHIFYGSFPQVFGAYVLGPWGWVSPDPAKIRQENWMHGEVFSGQDVMISANQPFHVKFRLLDYFASPDGSPLKPGRYQLNVKFFVRGGVMQAPVDSGPITFVVPAANGK